LRKLCDSGTASEFLKALKAAARPIKGRHDFSAFAASGDCNRSKVREIKKIEIQHVILSGAKNLIDPIHCGRSFVAKAHQDDTCGVISIDIKGTGFLKQMVRNIVGTMVGVANRSCPTDRATAMKYILNSRDRKKAHVTAPAAGLYLVEVKY
jgi:tRNA pseudouridine38-40 synthase